MLQQEIYNFLHPNLYVLLNFASIWQVLLSMDLGGIDYSFVFLKQVIVEGIGIFNLCLGRDFASSGFLHSSLYLLLENLISLNFEVRSAADAVLHVLSATSGYPTVSLYDTNSIFSKDFVMHDCCKNHLCRLGT
jgi:hypothetical protein